MSPNRARWGGAVVRGKASDGFTLVELLVVVGIVSLLTAVLLPTLSRARAQANNLACQSNLHQIGQAIEIYAGGSKGILPYGYWDGTFNAATGRDTGYNAAMAADWSVLLQSAVSANAGPNYDANFAGGLKSRVRQIFFDPDAPPGDTNNALGLTLTQYVCHPRLMPLLGQQDFYAEMNAPVGVRCFLRPYNLAHIRRGSEIAVIFDASLAPQVGGGWTAYPVPVAMSLDNGRINSDTYLTDQYNLAVTPGMNPDNSLDMTPAQGGASNSDLKTNSQNIRFRHMNNRCCNVLMADMHVESFALENDGQTDLKRCNVNVNP